MLYPSDYMPPKFKPKPYEAYIEKISNDNESPPIEATSAAEPDVLAHPVDENAMVIATSLVKRLKHLFNELENIDKQIWT